MERKEINEQLEAIREQLEDAAARVADLTNAAPYKLGSRISYVTDRIKQAVEEINACLEFPDVFQVEETEKTVTVWDRPTGLGFRFERGDRLAFYRFAVIHAPGALSSTEGMEKLNQARERFLTFAGEKFPDEFTARVH